MQPITAYVFIYFCVIVLHTIHSFIRKKIAIEVYAATLYVILQFIFGLDSWIRAYWDSQTFIIIWVGFTIAEH